MEVLPSYRGKLTTNKVIGEEGCGRQLGKVVNPQELGVIEVND